jgi:hypothetical protein
MTGRRGSAALTKVASDGMAEGWHSVRDILPSLCWCVRTERRSAWLDPEEQAVLDQVRMRLLEPDETLR